MPEKAIIDQKPSLGFEKDLSAPTQHQPKEGACYNPRIDFSKKSWFKPSTRFSEIERMIYKRMMREGVLEDEQRCKESAPNLRKMRWMLCGWLLSLPLPSLPPSSPPPFIFSCDLWSSFRNPLFVEISFQQIYIFFFFRKNLALPLSRSRLPHPLPAGAGLPRGGRGGVAAHCAAVWR